jgi:hypothetical protein
MGTGVRNGSDAGSPSVGRDYQQAWRVTYEEARLSGTTTNAARFVANERVLELRAADAGRRRPGLGDFEYY